MSLAQKIKDGLDLSKGHETSVLCLHEAISALHNIEAIIRHTNNFWRKVRSHCKNITESGLKSQIEVMQDSDSITRQKVWKSDVFKEAALEYNGQWVSLKDKCALATEQITLVQDEIDRYIRENPTKETAIKLSQKLAIELLDSKECKKHSDECSMISDT